MITFKKGNILEDDAPVLVNPVTLSCETGKGTDHAFKEAFPKNYWEYAKACRRKSFTAGRLCIVEDYHATYGHKIIVNFPIKFYVQDEPQYAYIVEGLDALRNYIAYTKPAGVAMPSLGCRYGGSEWYHIRRTILVYLDFMDTPVSVYEPYLKIVWSK